MRKTTELILLAFILFFFVGCEKEFFEECNSLKEGPIVTKTIVLFDIHSMDIGIPVELVIVEGDTQEIKIESTQAIIDAIVDQSSVRNEKWKVEFETCNFNNNTPGFPVKISATIKSLRDIKILGIGTARTEGIFYNAENIKLEVEGTGTFNVTLDNVQSVETKIIGAGEIKVAGTTQSQTVNLIGAGVINTFDLMTTNCNVQIEGDGEVEVFVNELLDGDIIGDGNICYKGNPTVDIKIVGTGQVSDCN